MNGWFDIGATQWFEHGTPALETQRFNHSAIAP